MDEADYFEQRLDNQIKWYSAKAKWNQRWFKITQIVVIVVTASIPFVTGYIDSWSGAKHLVGVMGLVAAVVAGIAGLYRFQEIWISYRMVCEALKQEKIFYQTKVEPYDTDDAELAFKTLVVEVEKILSQENQGWAKVMKSIKPKEPPKEKP